MKGRELYRLAVHAIARATRQALDEAGLTAADIHLFLFHQANLRLIQAAAAELRIPPEKLYTNLERYGNTSAASIPIALCEAIAEGRVGSGDYLAMIGFGAGFTWGVTIVRWG
jgi:3-oxoacyl-[acyl-carrier-protein] synthase-3